MAWKERSKATRRIHGPNLRAFDVESLKGEKREVFREMAADCSICICHYNDAPQDVRDSLASIVEQIDDRFEVIVVDNFSNNGSERVLEEYAEKGLIRVYRAKSTRGKARQIAFRLSSGRVVISNMDLDDTFQPELSRFLRLYSDQYDGRVVRVRHSPCGETVVNTSITIASRNILEMLGGWRDLQWFEDVDLWDRAEGKHLFSEVSYPLLKTKSEHFERQSLIGAARYRYVVDRDKMRLGYPTVLTLKKLPLYVASWLSARILGRPKFVRLDSKTLKNTLGPDTRKVV